MRPVKTPTSALANIYAPTMAPLIQLSAAAMQDVNKVIVARMASDVPLIAELASHLIAAGGKRLRPMLTIACALAGPDGANSDSGNSGATVPKAALNLAAAVEFIHSATLLHDDVIDQSNKRRGRDTANALWGNEASVLVGDFLFARAFELMVETDDIAVLAMLSSASARITEGEVKQMLMAGQPDAPLEDYLSVITNKTAILFAAAAEAGGRVGGANADICAALHAYGLALGRAFQIVDDALDYSADTASLGKSAGDDFNEGKITMPVILAWQDAGEEERAFWQRTLGSGDIADGDFALAQGYLGAHNAIERSLEAASAEAEAAANALSPLPDSPLKSALISAAFFAANRTS